MRRHLATLERLLAVPAADLEVAGADKVDAFLYDRSRDSLVALGSCNQPLSILQRRHGLDGLPVSNGGRTVPLDVGGARRGMMAAISPSSRRWARGARFVLVLPMYELSAD
jgi:hypothetical protein